MENDKKPPTSEVDILKATADYYKVALEDLLGKSRLQILVVARQVSMYLLRETPYSGRISYPNIGNLFKRDHTTVIYAVKKISRAIELGGSVATAVATIKENLYNTTDLKINERAVLANDLKINGLAVLTNVWGKSEPSKRNEEVFEKYSSGQTLQEVASAYKITRERVRQIVNAVFAHNIGDKISDGIDLRKEHGLFVGSITDRRSLKRSLERIRELAPKHRIKCLSETYESADSKLRWQCDKGHVWEEELDKIKNRKNWCPQCIRVGRRLELDEMKEVAKKRGGECLSRVYVNANSKLIWKCNGGHIWEATPGNVVGRKSWCPQCSGKHKLTIDEMRRMAEIHGGKFLSETYIDTLVRYKWECNKRHTWEATANSIRVGSWCPICVGRAPYQLLRLRKIAKARGGECLSEIYIDSNTKYLFECGAGHIWRTSTHNIEDNNTWCPECR